MSVDETTDSTGRHVANLLIGKMDGASSDAYTPNLISVKMLEKTNFSTISRFVNDGLGLLILLKLGKYKYYSVNFGIAAEKVILLVTDAAKYMLKAGDSLSVFYPNLIHVPCICHALHRTAEKIRLNFKQVDELIANTKKVIF